MSYIYPINPIVILPDDCKLDENNVQEESDILNLNQKLYPNEMIKFSKRNLPILTCDICGYKTKYKSKLKTHTKVHNKLKLFKCDNCEYSTFNLTNFEVHKEKHYLYKCDFCIFSCQNLSNLNIHNKKHINENVSNTVTLKHEDSIQNKNIFPSNHINSTTTMSTACINNNLDFSIFPDNSAISILDVQKPKKFEKKIIRKNKILNCEADKLTKKKSLKRIEINLKTTNNLDNSKIQGQIIVSTKPYKCSKCNYSCKSKISIKNHEKKHNNETISSTSSKNTERDQISQIKLNYGNENNPNPIQYNSDDKPLKCEFCDYRCRYESRLKYHTRTHTKERPFKCDLCSFSSTFRSDLTFHIERHIGNKKYKCPYCEYRSCVKRDLYIHIKIHDNLKPFACDLCEFRSNYKASMRMHKLSHSAETPYTCDVCAYKCKNELYLRHHKLKHEIILLKCDVCTYKTNSKLNLKNHMRKHTGDKIYKCNICDYTSFLTLKSHMLVHQQDKPYQCDKCGFTTKYRTSLRMHKNTHEEVKPFACDQCSYRCNKKNNLKKHKDKHANQKK